MPNGFSVLIVPYLNPTRPKFLNNNTKVSIKLIPRSRFLSNKLTVAQLVNKFRAFYIIQMIITVFKTASH